MASTRTKTSISREQTGPVHVAFDCIDGNYGAFIGKLREELANHPDKAEVHGRPVLAKQKDGPPNRLMHIKLLGSKDKTTTIAVRDDNVYPTGFRGRNGRWYEFGVEGSSVRILKESTFLGCEPTYRSLLGFNEEERKSRKGTKTHRKGWQDHLRVGKYSALQAISTLSCYWQPEGQSVDRHTRNALARLILMICDSARLAPIYRTVKNGWNKSTGRVISEQQVRYIYAWVRMSALLMGMRIQESDLGNIGVVEQKDATELVHLVLNKTWPIRHHLVPVPVLPVVNGRSMLDALRVEISYSRVGTVTFIDSIGGRIIIFNYPRPRSTYENTTCLLWVRTKPMDRSGHVSANSSFRVEIKPEADFDEYCSDGDDNFTGESKAVSSSTITTDSTDDAQSDLELDVSTVIEIPYNQGEADSCIRSSGLIGARGYPFYMEHVVLNNAMQATVQVKLKPKGVLTPDATIHLYGEIMAHCNGNKMFLLVKDEKDDMKLHLDILQTSDGLISIPIPLMRSVFAVTVGSKLILSVWLHVVCSSYDKTVSFKVRCLAFPNFGKRPKLTKKIDGPGMVAKVVVTAS